MGYEEENHETRLFDEAQNLCCRRAEPATGHGVETSGLGGRVQPEIRNRPGSDPPVNIRAQEAIDRIREATSGRVDIKLYPANQLGSDTDLLTQIRNGSVDFFNQSSMVLATFVPACGITSLGFAFKNYEQVWAAMDGDLGTPCQRDRQNADLCGFAHVGQRL